MIKVETFNHNLKETFPERDFHIKQKEFFKYALNNINNDRCTDRVTVFAARCGLGKSTFLQVLVKSWLQDNKNRGLIIVTDNLQRLASFNDDTDKRIAYLTAENKDTELVRQAYCPVLLMSTQRYFQMDSIEPFLTYYVGGNKYPRDTVIFDETPYFKKITKIGIGELNLLDSALNDGITDLCNPIDKEWLLTQYAQFKQTMKETINALEQKRNRTTYLFYHPEFTKISENDIRFYEIVNEFQKSINGKYPKAKEIFEDIEDFLQNGAFFSSFKLQDSNDYCKNFILHKDFKEKFMLGGNLKTFIFDASAGTSERYPCDAEWLTMLECNQFNMPLDFMHIHLVDVNTSRNALINQEDRETKLTAIKNYISGKDFNVDDTILVSYKALTDSNKFAEIGFDRDHSMYFGNVKGFNHNKDKHTLLQIGLNRQSDINYLLMFLSNNEDFELRLKNDISGIEDSIAECDRMLRSECTEEYMAAEVVTDLIQNVFRTKARELTNRDRIDVYLFCKYSECVLTEIQYSLGRLGASIEIEELSDLQISKIMNRKGESTAQKILSWIEKQECGREFTVDEFLAELGIEAKNFKVAKRNNSFIKKLFDGMKIENTRGKYRIADKGKEH